jgi:hypothetical protein
MQEFHRQNMLATNFRIHACLYIVIHKKLYVSTCEHVLIVFLTWGNSSQSLETMVEGTQIKSEANETLRFAIVCVCLYACVLNELCCVRLCLYL